MAELAALSLFDLVTTTFFLLLVRIVIMLGFDALKNQYTDMVESGIIDPTKVSRSVLQNAASVAATLLTTESIVTDIPTPPSPPMGGNPDMGGMY